MRRKVSIPDMVYERSKNMPAHKRAEILDSFASFRPRLYKSLQLPSYVHAYSLAIEYMTKWYLREFPQDFYKTVHINGKHVLDDWMHFNDYNIKREKPMLAVVPTLNTDYDRENIDMYLGGKDIMLRKSEAQQSFFRDYDNMQFLYLQMREIEMNFNFRSRVGTKAEQLDLYNKLELWFRVGQSQTDYLSVEFHIPYDMILNLAADANFKIVDNKIVDIIEFMNYLNTHSDLPILYKMRAINQKPEFFVRVKGLRAYITIRDMLQLDDGERDGKLDTNYHIDMQCQLRIPVPHFYAYLSQDPIKHTIRVAENKPGIGIYTIDNLIFRPENDRHWLLIAQSSYSCEKGEKEIDLSPIMQNKDWEVNQAIEFNNKMGISCDSFLEMCVWLSGSKLSHRRTNRMVASHMDYQKMKLILDEEVYENDILDFALYCDMNFVNSTMINLHEYDKSRIKPQKEKDTVIDSPYDKTIRNDEFFKEE